MYGILIALTMQEENASSPLCKKILETFLILVRFHYLMSMICIYYDRFLISQTTSY